MKRLQPAPLTDEDIAIWCGDRGWRLSNYHGMTCGDRRDAEIMLEIGWRSPGSAVVYVDIGDGQITAHCIAGRKRREEFERWLETEADEETRRIIYQHRRRRAT